VLATTNLTKRCTFTELKISSRRENITIHAVMKRFLQIFLQTHKPTFLEEQQLSCLT
jgi:hypothetical protein